MHTDKTVAAEQLPKWENTLIVFSIVAAVLLFALFCAYSHWKQAHAAHQAKAAQPMDQKRLLDEEEGDLSGQ